MTTPCSRAAPDIRTETNVVHRASKSVRRGPFPRAAKAAKAALRRAAVCLSRHIQMLCSARSLRLLPPARGFPAVHRMGLSATGSGSDRPAGVWCPPTAPRIPSHCRGCRLCCFGVCLCAVLFRAEESPLWFGTCRLNSSIVAESPALSCERQSLRSIAQRTVGSQVALLAHR